MAANLIKWIITSSSVYKALGTKDTNSLYFLEDTREIYKGATPYTESVVLYSGALPVYGAQGKLYVESTSLQGSIWTGSAWTTVIQPVSQAVVVDETATTLPVSGKAVADYVAAQGASIAAQAVTDISYDPATKDISFVKNGATTALSLTKIATGMSYNATTGKISLNDKEGTEIGAVTIPLDNFVTAGAYDATKKALVLTMQNGTEVDIPAADIVRIYDAVDTSSVDITITTSAEGTNIITAVVKVSATANNAIVINADGIYVDKEAILTVAPTTEVGKVLTVDAAGHSASSGVLLSDLATNASVEAIRSVLDTAKVDKASIVVAGTSVNLATPDSSKVMSEKAVVDLLSWTTL